MSPFEPGDHGDLHDDVPQDDPWHGEHVGDAFDEPHGEPAGASDTGADDLAFPSDGGGRDAEAAAFGAADDLTEPPPVDDGFDEWLAGEPEPAVDPAPGTVGALSDLEVDALFGARLADPPGAPDAADLVDWVLRRRLGEG